MTKLNVKEFGKALLDSNDLDPIYVMLHDSGLDLTTKKLWCLAYSCYYHAGVASFCAEDPKLFYKRLRLGHDEKWPRGAERRHFRGGTSDYVTSWLAEAYKNPAHAVNFLVGEPYTYLGKKYPALSPNELTFQDVTARVKSWKYFGPWIAFKWADLIDRVLGFPVDFSNCHLDIYEAPKQGAQLVAEYYKKDWSVQKVVAKLEQHFKEYKAPPFYDRPVNVQEVETVLCKWKSHLNGHYPPGKDTEEIFEGLNDWGDLAKHLQKFLPKGKR